MACHEEHTPPDSLPEVLTSEEVASLLRVNIKTIRELVATKQLPARKLGKKLIRYSKAAVLEWLHGQVRVSRSSRRK